MHNPPNARRRSETVCLFFFFLVDFLGYTPGTHDAWEAGHFVFLSGLVRLWKDTPLFPWLEMVWHAWPRRTARARVLGHFWFPFLVSWMHGYGSNDGYVPALSPL